MWWRRVHINYQWRLFLPLVFLLWTMLAVVVVWQYKREVNYRTQQIEENLALINSRILHAYQTDFRLESFMSFLELYYDENPAYDNLRISLYDASSEEPRLLFKMGDQVPYNPDDRFAIQSGNDSQVPIAPETVGFLGNEDFYYAVNHSHDANIVVYTAMAFGNDIRNALNSDRKMWIAVLILAIVFTATAFILSHITGRSVKLLRDFATKAATDPMFIPDRDFPRDELGEISHQIISLYHARTEANERLKREHRVAIRSMEEKNQIKRELTNNINHELKTPVSIVRGYLETIVNDPEMPEDTKRHFLKKALDNTNRLAQLLSELSTITRLDDGGGNVINTEKIDFHDITYNIVSETEESGVLRNMHIAYDVPFGCFVNANEELIKGMLYNLIKNSVLHSHGTQINIEMVDDDDKFYHFAVYDNGVGVGEEHLEHLFDRFYRVDKGRSRASGGTGLGLSIVYFTVQAHGGTIKVSNRKEGGLRFDFTLLKWQGAGHTIASGTSTKTETVTE